MVKHRRAKKSSRRRHAYKMPKSIVCYSKKPKGSSRRLVKVRVHGKSYVCNLSPRHKHRGAGAHGHVEQKSAVASFFDSLGA